MIPLSAVVLTIGHKGVKPTEKDPDFVVGKILYGKKIFSEEDCSTDREKFFWENLKLPFVYCIGRLFDMAGHRKAHSVAAILRDSAMNNEIPLARFSIEGQTAKKDGPDLMETIARAVAITIKPCNRSCNSGVLFDSFIDHAKFNDEDSMSKSEYIIGSFQAIYNPIIQEDDLLKALAAGGYNSAPGSLTQGSALSVEHLRERDMVKAQIQAAFRDWEPRSGKGLKKHLQEKLHDLPEMSDEYIDHFIEMIGYYKLKKSMDDLHIVPKDVPSPKMNKQRSFAFCKIANDFFGLGNHVPIVSENLISDGQVDHDIFPMNSMCCEKMSGSMRESVNNLLSDGSLDKVLLMDAVMGLNRTPMDYLTSYEAPYVALTGNENWGEPPTPSKSGLFALIENKPLHPQSILWLQALDEKKLLKLLQEHGTDNAMAKNIVARLTFLKETLNGRDCGNAGQFFKAIETFNMNNTMRPSNTDLNQPDIGGYR